MESKSVNSNRRFLVRTLVEGATVRNLMLVSRDSDRGIVSTPFETETCATVFIDDAVAVIDSGCVGRAVDRLGSCRAVDEMIAVVRSERFLDDDDAERTLILLKPGDCHILSV